MKLFNPWDVKKSNEPKNKGRGRPRKVTPDKNKDVIADEVYAASIYEALRHNRLFVESVEEEPDLVKEPTRIENILHMQLTVNADFTLDQTWEELPQQIRKILINASCKGRIQTDIEHSFDFHYSKEKQEVQNYSGSISDCLLAMLDEGHVDSVKRFLKGKRNRIVIIPDTIYQGEDDLTRLYNQVKAHIQQHYNTHGNITHYPEKVHWDRFLAYKQYLLNGTDFCEAYVRVMLDVPATDNHPAEDIQQTMLGHCRVLKILENKKTKLDPLLELDRESSEWETLKSEITKWLIKSSPEATLAESINKIVALSQKFHSGKSLNTLDFLNI